MKLESTTYHYAVKPPTPHETGGPREWPDLKKAFTNNVVYRPDNLSFDIHVTHETHTVRVDSVRLSGFRVVKDGLSEHRVHENHLFAGERPAFVNSLIAEALARHGQD